MTEFQQDNVRLNPGIGGANVATDFIESFGGGGQATGAHAQVVKLAYGGFNNAQLASANNPFPVRIQGINNDFATVPVGGDTQGGAVLVTGTFGIGNVEVTFDSISADVRSVAAGVTFGVQNVSGTTLDISGSSVIVSSVDLPFLL